MSRKQEYRDYIVIDVLRDIPGITTKKLFSGWGVYKYGRIFGIIIDDELYFKTNESNLKYFTKYGSHPFSFERQGKTVSLPYWTLPDAIFSDEEKLIEWIERSLIY